MEKAWYMSKAFYASLLIAGGVIGNYLAGNLGVQEAIIGVGSALGLFGIRDALK